MDNNWKTEEQLTRELEKLHLDISELQDTVRVYRQAEEKWKFQKSHLESLIHYSALAIVTLDKDHIIITCNHDFEKLFQYKEFEIVGKNLDEVVGGQKYVAEAKSYTKVFLRGEAVHGSGKRCRKDGTYIEVEFHGVPVIIEGKVAGAYGIYLDITDRKLLERKHEQLNRLKEAMITSKTLEEKLKIITDGMVQIFQADFARIWIVRPGDRCSDCIHDQFKEGPHVCRSKDQCLHLTSSSGRYTHLDGEIHRRVPYGCYKIGLVASGDLPGFITNEVTQDPRVHNPDWVRAIGLVSFAGYRLLSAEGESVGVMALFSRHCISSDDNVLLEGLANSIAQVIQIAKAEESLRESEEHYRTAIEQSNDGVVLVKGDRHIFVNQKMMEIFGYNQPEEIIGKPIDLIVHPDDQARVKDINRRRQKGEAVPLRYEFKGQKKNGEPIHIEVSATKTTFQGEAVSLASLRDITERKQAEEALRLSEEKFTKAFRASPDWMTLSTLAEGRFIDVNDAFVELSGFSREEALGKTAVELGIWVDTQERDRGVEIIRKEGFLKNYEAKVRLKSGEIRTTLWSLETFDFENQKFVIASSRDITERKQAEQALRESEERYRSILESIEEGYYEVDLAGNLIFFNEAIGTMLGYSRDELLGMNNRQFTEEKNLVTIQQKS